jgi:hypothetical protein
VDITTENTFPDWAGKHRQAMHMPRWASRLFIEITDVRIERLQNIDGIDAVAEGVRWLDEGKGAEKWGVPDVIPYDYPFPAPAYFALWNHINGPGAWEKNPFVLAYTFKVHKGSVDDYLHERIAP